jgi:Uma2 family endonuclease
VETRAREQLTRRRFTAEEYHRMGEVGILRDDERVELIEGEIVEMNPIGGRHAACVRMLTRLLGRSLGDELLLDVENPIRLNGGFETGRTWRWSGRATTGSRSLVPKTSY